MKTNEEINWEGTRESLHQKGFAQIPHFLSPDECRALIALYPDELYRNTINMERYRFGRGEYKYFSYPLPAIIQHLREQFYTLLAPVANQWAALLDSSVSYPATHGEFIAQCQAQKQLRPTPLILHYRTGGYNTLHQDLYGDVYFPLQVVFMLSQSGEQFEGGQLVMTEQLPRAQSKASVISPDRGDALIFTTNFRPVKGARGYFRSRMKHGVAEIISGERHALGIIFHDSV